MILRNTSLVFILFTLKADMSSGSNNSHLMLSAFFKASPAQLISSKNVSTPSASLLSCVVRGTRDDTCLAVNFSDQDGICQLIYSDGVTAIYSQPIEGNSTHWRSVEIREIQNVDNTSPSIATESNFPSTSDTAQGCSPDMTGGFGGSCYKLVREETAMFAAVTWCEGDGGHLVDIDSQEEQDALCGFVAEGTEIWTGGTFDKGVAYWTSSGQDMGYTNWLNSVTPTQTIGAAVYLDSSMPGCPWREQSFTAPKVFICEYKK